MELVNDWGGREEYGPEGIREKYGTIAGNGQREKSSGLGDGLVKNRRGGDWGREEE